MSEKLGRIRAAIYAAAGGETAFKTELPFLFRQAIDELIDAPRTRRLRLSDLEPNEKAVLGIKVEAALRQFLDFPRGKLDFLIAGYDVDVKFTSSNNSWMIPPEAVGQVCLLAKTDERRSIFSIGLIEAKPENLTKGQNRDKKLGVSKAGRETVDWFAFEQPFPSNIWESVSEREAKAIFQPSSGTERIVALFSVFEGQPIHRSTIHAVARQHDYMKRIRANQGARDVLHPIGIVVLSGTQDGPLLRALNVELGKDFVLPFRPKTTAELAAIQSKPRHAKGFVYTPNPDPSSARR